MDTLVFHTEANRVNANILESIKAFFGNQKVEISVKSESTLASMIEQNKNSGISYTFDANEFDAISEKILNDEALDFESYLKANP